MTCIKPEAERIADRMYKSQAEKTSALHALLDLFDSFNGDSVHVTIDRFLESRGLLIEIVCLLSNPEVSSQIQEDYYKKNAARIFKEMIFFFERLTDDEAIHKYLTWYNLSHFSANAKQSELEHIENTYLKGDN